MADDEFRYAGGFGNEFATEAVDGALPAGRNSPQQAPLGLYAEQISGTAFTQPRGVNRRTWVYRILPSAKHPAFTRIDNGRLRSTPFDEIEPDPNRLRWDPLPVPSREVPADFIDGLYTVAGNGDVRTRAGLAVHLYAANEDMIDRYFADADGELLFVPELSTIVLHTELGPLRVSPGEIAVVPRGIRFRVELPDGYARGYLCENFGAGFTLPERGPIGANGLANERDFKAPHAAFEERNHPVQVVQKFGGNLWAAGYDHSPLDVVAWHGNYAPYKYDTANFMGLVRGVYDAKAEGFTPGGGSWHNTFAAHGPDGVTYARASTAELAPQKLDGTLAFMFESRWMMVPTRQAIEAGHRQRDYDAVWSGLQRNFR